MRPVTSILFPQHRTSSPIGTLIGALGFCVAFGVLLNAGAQAATDPTASRVQILNGKTGRPLANQHFRLSGKDAKAVNNKGETTDGEGYAPIPNLDVVSNVFISVDLHVPCSKTEKHDFSLAKVRAAGVVSENSCRPRITMYPQPGTLIFYVREQTFLEKMRR